MIQNAEWHQNDEDIYLKNNRDMKKLAFMCISLADGVGKCTV